MKAWQIMYLIDFFILIPFFIWYCFGDHKKKKK